MSRRALLLINPRSRRGAESAEIVRTALQGAGLDVRCAPDGAESSAQIRENAAEVDLVVIGGGDGSVNAAVPALLETKLPFGVIPLGTGNDFARTIGLPLEPEAAARVIAAGHLAPIDVGEANGHPFLNVANIGLGVDLTRALTRDAKRRWGVLGYAVAGLRVLRRVRPFTAWIEHGGQTHVSRTVHVAIGNGRHYGGGMVVDEHARIDDGRLHAFSLEVDHWWQVLRLLPALRRGTVRDWAEIRTLAGEEVTVRTRRTRSVNTDGEITTETPVTIRVQRAALRVFVPPPE
ncbi:MAG: lipid kinase [Rhodospirillales bacterium]|nr:lipid kinase [Rhodospirillales bacterium]